MRTTRPAGRQKPTMQPRPSHFDVVLFGNKYLRWSPRLPSDPIWNALPQVSSVTHQGDEWRPKFGADQTDTQRLVLPLHERNIYSTPRGSWALVPKLKALRAFADKQRFSEFVVAEGLEAFAPTPYAPGSEDFPLVLKRTNLTGSDGVVVVRSRAELTQRLAEPRWLGRSVIMQEYVDGTVDHVAHAVCVRGRLAWHCHYSYQTPPGEILLPRVARPLHEPLSESDRDVISKFTIAASFDGPVSVDYRRRADGRLAILEINPRFGGSLFRLENRSDLRDALGTIIANVRWHG